MGMEDVEEGFAVAAIIGADIEELATEYLSMDDDDELMERAIYDVASNLADEYREGAYDELIDMDSLVLGGSMFESRKRPVRKPLTESRRRVRESDDDDYEDEEIEFSMEDIDWNDFWSTLCKEYTVSAVVDGKTKKIKVKSPYADKETVLGLAVANILEDGIPGIEEDARENGEAETFEDVKDVIASYAQNYYGAYEEGNLSDLSYDEVEIEDLKIVR